MRLFTCRICLDMPPDDSICLEPCKHGFCRGCIKSYIDTKLDERKFPICALCARQARYLAILAILAVCNVVDIMLVKFTDLGLQRLQLILLVRLVSLSSSLVFGMSLK